MVIAALAGLVSIAFAAALFAITKFPLGRTPLSAAKLSAEKLRKPLVIIYTDPLPIRRH